MNKQAMNEQMTTDEFNARLELIKRRAWNDLYYFSKHVCGKDLMRTQPHKELCDFIIHGVAGSEQLGLDTNEDIPFKPDITTNYVLNESRGTLEKLIMLPRGAFKSTIGNQTVILWMLWHNQNLRIMLDSETLANAKLHLAGIKTMILENEMLKLICTDINGEYVLEPSINLAGGFTEDQVILKRRTKTGMKEPSIFCSGVDNARTGMHPDIIIMDDIVSERNVKTEDQINKTKEHYKFSLALLEPGGLQLVIGTRYHKADLYGDLIDVGSLDTLIRPAILDGEKLYFPSRLTEEFLEEQRKKQGSYIFNSQYMLEPINDEESSFRIDDIRYYSTLPNMVNKYLIIDPAVTVTKRSDYSVIIIVGEDSEKNFYVIDYVRKRMLPKALIDEIFRQVDIHQNRLRSVSIETVAGFKVLLYNIKDEMRRRSSFFKLNELSPRGVKKEDRIKNALEPLFSNHFVHIRRTHIELENELIDFPYGAHDDIIDALSYIVDVTKPGILRKMKKARKYKPKNSITGY